MSKAQSRGGLEGAHDPSKQNYRSARKRTRALAKRLMTRKGLRSKGALRRIVKALKRQG